MKIVEHGNGVKTEEFDFFPSVVFIMKKTEGLCPYSVFEPKSYSFNEICKYY